MILCRGSEGKERQPRVHSACASLLLVPLLMFQTGNQIWASDTELGKKRSSPMPQVSDLAHSLSGFWTFYFRKILLGQSTRCSHTFLYGYRMSRSHLLPKLPCAACPLVALQAMQLDQFDVYHWTGMRCWYDVQYKKGTCPGFSGQLICG